MPRIEWPLFLVCFVAVDKLLRAVFATAGRFKQMFDYLWHYTVLYFDKEPPFASMTHTDALGR